MRVSACAAGCIVARECRRSGRGADHSGRVARAPPRVTQLAEHVHIGNFVELKKTSMGKGAKANHLAYLGDATIGAKTNVGAIITWNYDGEKDT